MKKKFVISPSGRGFPQYKAVIAVKILARVLLI